MNWQSTLRLQLLVQREDHFALIGRNNFCPVQKSIRHYVENLPRLRSQHPREMRRLFSS